MDHDKSRVNSVDRHQQNDDEESSEEILECHENNQYERIQGGYLRNRPP